MVRGLTTFMKNVWLAQMFNVASDKSHSWYFYMFLNHSNVFFYGLLACYWLVKADYKNGVYMGPMVSFYVISDIWTQYFYVI